MSSTFNWIKYFEDFRFSISIKKSCLKCPICFREVLGPLIFGNNKIDKLCTTNWLQLKEETSFNCANCKHPMHLKAHRQNGEGCIWRVFPMYMLNVNYFFNNVKYDSVFMFRGRHIMLQKLNIMFFRVALKSVFLWSKCSTLVKVGKL